jgi:hypothetical protein
MVTQQMERQSARELDLMMMLQCCIWCGVRDEEYGHEADMLDAGEEESRKLL